MASVCLSMLVCSGKHWNVSSIHVNLILTVLVDALAPWGAMSSTVTMLNSWLDLFLSRHQYAHVLIVMSMASVCSCANSSVNCLSMLVCSGKHWNVSSIHVNLILTVLVDALAPWGAMSSTVTMLNSWLDLFLSRHQYAHSSVNGLSMIMCS